jgi:hypothetical protein
MTWRSTDQRWRACPPSAATPKSPCWQQYRCTSSCILDPQPFRDWTPLGLNKDGTLAHPCSRCAARRGAHEHSLTATPEIITAARRHRALRRRHPATSDLAFVTATHLTSTWRSWSVESRSGPELIDVRWNARAQLLPGIPDGLIRYPETIAFTALFASTPSMMLTIRGGSRRAVAHAIPPGCGALPQPPGARAGPPPLPRAEPLGRFSLQPLLVVGQHRRAGQNDPQDALRQPPAWP